MYGILCRLRRLPVWRRGTRYRDICVILSTLLQFLDDYLRHSSFQSTSAHSTLVAVFGVDALYKSTFYLLTYLLTYSIGLWRALN